MKRGAKKLSYKSLVDYSIADPAKVLAQQQGKASAKNLPFGFKELSGTRGESAYVFDMGDMYGALVQEGLGTKSLVAQAVYEQTGKSYFAQIAQDTVATIINDLISVGATPVVTNAYWSSSSYDWLKDQKMTQDFITGWRQACDKAGVSWGGGETQALSGIIANGALEFAGSAFGVIKPKSRLISAKNLKAGDVILLIESSGVHANGISLTRKIATQLKDGYQTRLASGQTFGEALLVAAHIYAELLEKLSENKVKVSYVSNITGHGWRKLMRADRPFTYRIQNIPPPPEIFKFIAAESGNNVREMYSNYNMGAGYAIYLAETEVVKAQQVAKQLGLKSWAAGRLEKGPKRVIIEPVDIIFEGKSLAVR